MKFNNYHFILSDLCVILLLTTYHCICDDVNNDNHLRICKFRFFMLPQCCNGRNMFLPCSTRLLFVPSSVPCQNSYALNVCLLLIGRLFNASAYVAGYLSTVVHVRVLTNYNVFLVNFDVVLLRPTKRLCAL